MYQTKFNVLIWETKSIEQEILNGKKRFKRLAHKLNRCCSQLHNQKYQRCKSPVSLHIGKPILFSLFPTKQKMEREAHSPRENVNERRKRQQILCHSLCAGQLCLFLLAAYWKLNIYINYRVHKRARYVTHRVPNVFWWEAIDACANISRRQENKMPLPTFCEEIFLFLAGDEQQQDGVCVQWSRNKKKTIRIWDFTFCLMHDATCESTLFFLPKKKIPFAILHKTDIHSVG